MVEDEKIHDLKHRLIPKFENKEQIKGYLMALSDVRDMLGLLEKRLLDEVMDEVIE